MTDHSNDVCKGDQILLRSLLPFLLLMEGSEQEDPYFFQLHPSYIMEKFRHMLMRLDGGWIALDARRRDGLKRYLSKWPSTQTWFSRDELSALGLPLPPKE